MNAPAPLSAIQPSETLLHPDIASFLKDTRAEAVVLKSGQIYHAIDDSRLMMRLMAKVREVGITPQQTKVSPMDIATWKTRSSPDTGSQKVTKSKVSNESVRHILSEAIEAGASDVYVKILSRDPEKQKTILSFRTYGFKRPISEFTHTDGESFATALWAISNTNSWNRDRSCDTAISFKHKGRNYRVRANSVKDIAGNTIVLRIRDPQFVLSLSDSGYSGLQSNHIQHMMAAPGGLLLITGETNSGKSTTLTSLLADLSDEQHIIEIADPVEAEFDHVTHIEINKQAEDAEKVMDDNLGATVRQNPDTLILAEIRDDGGVTARAAMSMSIQGKRVMSTLHTKACTSAIPRLVELGVNESLTALPEFIIGIVSQNLVPKLCPHCCLADHPDHEVDREYKKLFGDGVRFRNELGCDECSKKIPGIAGETLVAEAYPLCLDRSAGAFKLIAEKKYYMLPEYMKEKFGVQSKFEHAASKIKAGLIDPIATARTIGEFLVSFNESSEGSSSC